MAKFQLTLLHFRDQFLIEQTSSLLVQRAVDGDYVTLGQHLLQIIHTSAPNLLLNFGFKRLVIEIQQLLAVEGLQSPQHTFANAPNSDCTHYFVLKIIFVLGNGGDVPVSTRNLFVSWDEVANKGEDSHEHMLCHRHDVRASDLSDCDATVSLICSIQVNVIRSNAGCDREFELLSFSKPFGGQVTWMEADSNGKLAQLF